MLYFFSLDVLLYLFQGVVTLLYYLTANSEREGKQRIFSVGWLTLFFSFFSRKSSLWIEYVHWDCSFGFGIGWICLIWYATLSSPHPIGRSIGKRWRRKGTRKGNSSVLLFFLASLHSSSSFSFSPLPLLLSSSSSLKFVSMCFLKLDDFLYGRVCWVFYMSSGVLLLSTNHRKVYVAGEEYFTSSENVRFLWFLLGSFLFYFLFSWFLLLFFLLLLLLLLFAALLLCSSLLLHCFSSLFRYVLLLLLALFSSVTFCWLFLLRNSSMFLHTLFPTSFLLACKCLSFNEQSITRSKTTDSLHRFTPKQKQTSSKPQ